MKRSNAKINDSARRDLCPPLSSDKDCFHTLPKATRTSRPSRKVPPSGGSSFAMVPGNRVEKIDPKSWLTLTHVTFRVSFFLLVELLNHFRDFGFVILNCIFLRYQRIVFIFCFLEHSHNLLVHSFFQA